MIDHERFRVPSGSAVSLAAWTTDGDDVFPSGKSDGRAALAELTERLAEFQGLLYAEAEHKLLIVLQGMDTAGKDGTVRHVFSGVNPLGVRVQNFKRPTSTESAHDYLWRIHQHTPPRGSIQIFNRSHYEDVLVSRVHALLPADRIERRYGHIRDFEQMLADEGVTIIKFFLHISKDEQKRRLQARLDDPEKHWKFESGDLEERKWWDDYLASYERAISETARDHAPWYVVPSDRKWLRNLLVSSVVVAALEGLDMAYPEAEDDLDRIRVE